MHDEYACTVLREHTEFSSGGGTGNPRCSLFNVKFVQNCLRICVQGVNGRFRHVSTVCAMLGGC
jgi:hypothetical protein